MRVETRGKVGYNWRREHFRRSIGNLGEPPFFFSSPQCLSNESLGNPTHMCLHMLARLGVCVCVCLYSYTPYGSMDTCSACLRNFFCATGNERGDELLVAIAATHRATGWKYSGRKKKKEKNLIGFFLHSFSRCAHVQSFEPPPAAGELLCGELHEAAAVVGRCRCVREGISIPRSYFSRQLPQMGICWSTSLVKIRIQDLSHLKRIQLVSFCIEQWECF